MKKQNVEIFQELIKRDPSFLDKPIEELLPMRFLGEAAVSAYKGIIKHLDDLPLAQEEKQAKLKDGQAAGEALLMIESRIGQIYKNAPEAPSKGRLVNRQIKTKKELVEQMPKELKSKSSQRKLQKAAEIASHPEIVKEVIKEAKENEDIPSKGAVLAKIALKREKERKAKRPDPPKAVMRADALIYFNKLKEAISIIPTTPPQDLLEQDYLILKSAALLVLKRLKAFFEDSDIKKMIEKMEEINGQKTKSLSP